MGRKKDENFWKHVDNLLNGRVMCKFCEREFYGGSTRIKSHLSGLSGRDIVICSKVPPDVKLAAREAITAPEKKLGKLRSLNNDGETEVISTSAPNKKAKSFHQPTILGECKKDKSEVDKMLAKFFISSNITPDYATIRCLVNLLRSVAEFGTSYKIPNTSSLTSQLIPGIYKEVEEHVGNVKKLFTTTGCTLVMYHVEKYWGNGECFNAFAYSPAGVIYVGKIEVPKQRMTFSYFKKNICSIIDYLGPENVVQCFLDHSIIIRIDLKKDDSVHDRICRIYPCILLHQNATNGFSEILLHMYISVPWIRKTAELAVVIFRYLHKHNFNLLPQRDHTSNIKEYYGVAMTEIAINFFVLRTILEVEKELQVLQLPIASESCEGNVAEIVDKAIHSTEFWSIGKKVVQVLRSLFRFLEFIDGNCSTFGYLYEASKKTEEAIKQQCDGDDQINCEIIELFEDWKSQAVKPVHAAAAFLNPAYFCSENFTEDTDEMQEGLQHLMLLVPREEREALSEQLQLYRERIPDLFSDTTMKKLKTIHPGKWWECFGDPCPILQKLAVRILSQPCLAPLFLKLVNVQPNSPVDKLRMNMILMENFGTVKSQNSEPIQLTSEEPDYAYVDVLKFLDEEVYRSEVAKSFMALVDRRKFQHK